MQAIDNKKYLFSWHAVCLPHDWEAKQTAVMQMPYNIYFIGFTLQDKKAKLQSITTFDVFDTLITRAVADPSAVYLLLGRRLSNLRLIRCTPEAFAHARMYAGRCAWRNAAGHEPTLAQVYGELRASLQLTAEQMTQLMNLELELESQLIRVVPDGKDRVQEARRKGHRVVFVSDMYVSSRFIKELLTKYSRWSEGDGIYVSCEHGKSKRSGGLFQELLKREDVVPSAVCHVGNDLKADIEAPKRMGFQVDPFLLANVNRYERILESHSFATEGLTSVMAGASRLARLNISATTPKEEALRDVAAGVIAPLLVGFTLWILHRAQKLGLKRLYFLSRDGQILLEIARTLRDRLNLDCELRYLYGSREAFSLPSIIEANEEELSQVCFGGFSSVRSLLSRAHIEPEEIEESLESIGLGENSWRQTLNADECRALYRLMLQDRSIKELILEKAAEHRALLIEYMQQEGMFDPIEWGIVDLGWRGTIQNALNRVLATEGRKVPIGLYFGVRHNSQSRPLDSREAYFFDERFGWGLLHIFPRYGLLRVLEAFCYADHGTVIDFKENCQKVQPVLKDKNNQQLMDWGLPLIRKTVGFFAENLLLDPNLVSLETDVRGATADTLKAFWLTPTTAEAMAFGGLPYDVGYGKSSYQLPFARRYQWKHVIGSFWSGNEGREHPAMWEEGSFALTPYPVRYALKGAIRLSRALMEHQRH